jgi:hypothetical protein
MTIALSSFELPDGYSKTPSKFVSQSVTDTNAVRFAINPNNTIQEWTTANLSAEDLALWTAARQAKMDVIDRAIAAGDYAEVGAGIFEWKSAETLINYMQTIDPTLNAVYNKVWYLYNQATYNT